MKTMNRREFIGKTAMGAGATWAAKTGSVKTFFVEMDLDKFKDSATYIQGI